MGKYIFAVNFPLKLLRATVEDADTGSLKSLHTLFDTYLYHMLAKSKLNRMVQNIQFFKIKNSEYFQAIFDEVLVPFCETFFFFAETTI